MTVERDDLIHTLTERTPSQPRIACFDFVSDKVFHTAVTDALHAGELRDTDGKRLEALSPNAVENALAARKLPLRATTGSAGYDFFSPVSFRLMPGDSVTVLTGVRCAIDPGWVLVIAPKSGKGSKFRVMLRNTLAFIDSDYYESDNEGHIMLKLINDNYDGKPMDVRAGDALMQGLFLPYGVALDDDARGVRNGGFGSTVR